MQGLILAAGMGKRLKELTQNNTKCMVDVCGTPLIDRTMRQLDALGLTRIVIVVGYEGQKLIDHIGTLDLITPVIYVDNPIYDRTNNIYSLLLAKEQLIEDDTLLLESDIIFEDRILRDLLDDPRPSLALVDAYESWMDGTCVTLDEEDKITSFVSKADFGARGCVFAFSGDDGCVRLYTDLSRDEAAALHARTPLVDLYGNTFDPATWFPGSLLYAHGGIRP